MWKDNFDKSTPSYCWELKKRLLCVISIREREKKMRRREYESLYYWKATKGPYLPPLKQQSEAKALSHDDTTLFNKTGLTVMTTASEP